MMVVVANVRIAHDVVLKHISTKYLHDFSLFRRVVWKKYFTSSNGEHNTQGFKITKCRQYGKKQRAYNKIIDISSVTSQKVLSADVTIPTHQVLQQICFVKWHLLLEGLRSKLSIGRFFLEKNLPFQKEKDFIEQFFKNKEKQHFGRKIQFAKTRNSAKLKVFKTFSVQKNVILKILQKR